MTLFYDGVIGPQMRDEMVLLLRLGWSPKASKLKGLQTGGLGKKTQG